MSKIKENGKKMSKKFYQLKEDFKKFISKGNVVDMAVGVIIGGAFSAIITAVVQGILMPIITWAIPSGGIDGLVTVLNPAAAAVTEDTVNVISYWGVEYDKDIVNVINWGSFVNALIYFFAVAILLFTVIKVFGFLQKKREKLEKEQLEKYYEKFPEERPVPNAPKLTELQVLEKILAEVKKQNETK